jgi:hypothetical protein
LIAWQISLGMASLGRLLIHVLLMCRVPKERAVKMFSDEWVQAATAIHPAC